MTGRASLNHIYRTVWNSALGAMVAVAEIESGAGRTAGVRPRSRARALRAAMLPPDARALALLTLCVAIGWSGAGGDAHAQTLPQGGVAIHGTAGLNYSQPNKLTVTTTNGAGTGHSAVNWNSFNIGAGATTNFVQPSAASLSINRVVTNTPSQLFGTLSSNGKIVLVNQSGIAVGAGAVVDTAGFTASAVGMKDADAMAGRLRFGGSELGNHTGSLRVDGNIIARGGDVVLIAPSIDLAKMAVVESQGGSVSLAAGQSVEITGRGLEGITLHVQAPADQAINLGTLKGDAVGIFAGTLRHSGMVQAVTADRVGGKVILRASGDAYVEGQGKIVATSSAAGNKGGSVDVLGSRVAIADQALIDVSGQAGGGNIRIGGGFQGKDTDVPNASKTYVGSGATLKADALDAGTGGRVIVWADEQTRGHGTISARGGANGGDGGFVEVSGKRRLAFDATVDTRAPQGKTGTLLLDPDFIEIAIGGVAALSTVDQFADFGTNLTIAPATINGAATNVMLQANEDITFTDPVNMVNLGVGLTAQAGGVISVNAPITTNQGNIFLYAAHPLAGGSQPGGSALNVGAAINSNGANITLRSDGSDVGGNSLVLNSGAAINAGAGTVNLIAPNDRIEQFAGSSITAAFLDVLADYTIDLNQPGNSITGSANFSSNLATGSGTLFAFRNSAPTFDLIGAVSRGNLGFSIITSGSMSTSGVMQSGGNMAITAPGGVAFSDDVTVAGLLNVTTSGGAITNPTGVFNVSGGLATFNAVLGSINLASNFNNFSSIALSGGGSVHARDNNAMTVTSLALNSANTAVDLQAGAFLALPTAAINTGTSDLSLLSGTFLQTNGALSGQNVFLQSNAGLINLSHNVTAAGNLSIAANGGAITQLAGSNVTVSGNTTAFASGNINLTAASNGFGGLVNLNTANSATLVSQSSVQLGNVNAGSNLSVTTANQIIGQGGGTSITVGGATTLNAGSNDVNLFNATNNFNTVAVSGRSIGLVDTNAMTVTSLSNPGAINLYLEAGGQLTLPATNLNASFQATLFSGGSLATNGTISAAQVSLAGASGVSLAHNVTASTSLNIDSSAGNVDQTAGAVIAGGTTSVTAAGFINLTGATNDFNALNATAGGLVSVNDSGAVGISHQNITGTSVSIIAQGGIFRQSGTITSTSGNISLQGANIGDDTNPPASFVALDPAGAVILNSLFGGVYVRQAAGDLNLGNYTVAVPTAGQHIKIASDVAGANVNVAFTNFNGSTDDDLVDIISTGNNNSIFVSTIAPKAAASLKLRTEGAGSNISFQAGSANNFLTNGGLLVEAIQGDVILNSTVTNQTGAIGIYAGNSVLSNFGAGLQTVGSLVNVEANKSDLGFLPSGSGLISIASVDTTGAAGTNSANALDATGKTGGGVSLFVGSGTGGIAVDAIYTSGGAGATETTSGTGMPGGNGGSVNIVASGNIISPLLTIDTAGGAGGIGTLTTGGAGGNAADVLVNSLAGNVAIGVNIFAQGGVGGNAVASGLAGASGGAGANVNIDSFGSMSVNGAIRTKGGNGGNALLGGATAPGGAGGSAGDVSLTAGVGSGLSFAGTTTLDATGGFTGLDSTGASGSFTSGDIALGGASISQSAGAAVQTVATTVHLNAGAGGINLTDLGNSFGEVDGTSSGNAVIAGLYGVGNGGLAALGNMSLTGLAVPLQPLWIQGALSATNISLNGNVVNIRDNIAASGNLSLTSSGAIVQDQLGGGSSINVGGVTTIAGGSNVDLSGPSNNFSSVSVASASNVTVNSISSMTVTGATVTGSADFESTSGNLTISGTLSAPSQVLLFSGGSLTATGIAMTSTGGQINMAAGSGINLSGSTLTAGGDLDISTQGGPLNATGASISGVAGNWRTYLSNYASGGHSFGPFDPLINADYRQVNGNFGTILGTGNGSLWLDSGIIPSGVLVGAATKTFDGNTSISLAGVGLSGLVFNEPVVNLIGQTGVLADPNAGVGKAVTLTGPLSLDGLVTTANGRPTYGYALVSATGNVGTVNPATVTVASLNGTREYDGTTLVNAGIFNINGLINAETLTLSGAGTIADKNVGVDKPVNIGLSGQGGLTLGNGTGLASNYTLAFGTHRATITRRTQSNWLGGSGQWSNPTSWDVMPDAANVAGVAIPAGVQVVYDAAAGTTQLDRILSAGRVIMAGGNLQIGDTLRTFQYGQTGGLLDGNGNLVVESQFSKTGGLINLGGLVEITQSIGNLVVGGMRGGNMLLKAENGGISQTGPLATPGALGAQATQAIVLDNANNNLNGFAAFTSNGDVELVNAGGLDIKGILAQNGDVKVTNTGGIFTSKGILVPNGKLLMVANSPMVIGQDGITASGDIDLLATNQTSPGDMLLIGDLTSTQGDIHLGAAGNFRQNSFLSAAGEIKAVVGGSITFGPLAISSGNPVSYTSGGVPVLNPPSSLGELLARNNGVGGFINEFLDKFEDALAARADDDEDPLRKKDKTDLVVEGEICRP